MFRSSLVVITLSSLLYCLPLFGAEAAAGGGAASGFQVNIHSKVARSAVAQDSAHDSRVRLSDYTEGQALDPEQSIVNTRFRKCLNLEFVVNQILAYADQPGAKPLAVFDVDETLIDRKTKRPLHPRSNELLASLRRSGIPILLITMSERDIREKFREAGLNYDGIVDNCIYSVLRNAKRPFTPLPKGDSLRVYLRLTENAYKPTHVFFADDRLDSDSDLRKIAPGVPMYIKSVEAVMLEMGMPFTTFHFNLDVNR
jgi:hypothetical protein